MNYYRRYVGDYLKKTIRLTMAGHGAYGLMLDYYYAEEHPLPLDMEDVYAIARAATPADRRTVDKVLASYFERREDGFHNSRADEEIAAAGKARENGARGGRPRTGSETGQVTGISESGYASGSEKRGEKVTGSGHPPTTNHQPRSKERAGRGSRLPPDWQPSPEGQAYLAKERRDLDLQATAANFRDYWVSVPGAKGVKLDWEATWRTWVRKEKGAHGAPLQLARKVGPCGNCGTPLTGGWSQSPKGRVCDDCHRGYMSTGWPKKKGA